MAKGGDFNSSGKDGEECNVFLVSSTGGIYYGLEIFKVSVDRPSRLINAPVEMGKKTFDNKVIDPKTITLSCYVSSENFGPTLDKLEQEYLERSFKFCTIVTKEGVYTNMALQNMPHVEDPDKYDVIEMTLTFKEVILTGGEVASPNNSDYASKRSVGKKGLS